MPQDDTSGALGSNSGLGVTPRFARTYCSQCGGEFGPGNSGFSHCSDHFRRVPGWDCADGTPEEDHDWKLIVGDSSVGEGDYMECRQCGKEREATEAEIADSWHDPVDD